MAGRRLFQAVEREPRCDPLDDWSFPLSTATKHRLSQEISKWRGGRGEAEELLAVYICQSRLGACRVWDIQEAGGKGQVA